jgi:hypothetical protein
MKSTRIQVNPYLFENEIIFIFMNIFKSLYFRMYDLQYFKAILRYCERVKQTFNDRKIQYVMTPLGIENEHSKT